MTEGMLSTSPHYQRKRGQGRETLVNIPNSGEGHLVHFLLYFFFTKTIFHLLVFKCCFLIFVIYFLLLTQCFY